MVFKYKPKLLSLCLVTFCTLICIEFLINTKNIYAETTNLLNDQEILAAIATYYRTLQQEDTKKQEIQDNKPQDDTTMQASSEPQPSTHTQEPENQKKLIKLKKETKPQKPPTPKESIKSEEPIKSKESLKSEELTFSQKSEKLQEPIQHQEPQPIKHEIILHNRTKDRFNGTFWAGAEFMFTPKSFSKFVSSPMIGVQIGASKSIYNVTPYSFLYLGLIFNYGNSQESNIINVVSTGSWYYFMNEEIVLGYEVPLGDPHIAIFAEAGPALQQFAFGIENKQTIDAIDYVAAQTFAGAFNLGFNINLAPRNDVLCLIRLGAKAIIGQPKSRTPNYNDENLNTNPFMFGPVVSIAIRK